MVPIRTLICLTASVAMLLQAVRWWIAGIDWSEYSIAWVMTWLIGYESIWALVNIYGVFELIPLYGRSTSIASRAVTSILTVVFTLLMLAQLAFARAVLGGASTF